MYLKNKYWILFACIVMDLMGMLSYIIPGLGEGIDIVWAPLASFMMIKLFGDKVEGKIGAVITFVEELSVGLDFVPTFTITWIFRYLVRNTNSDN